MDSIQHASEMTLEELFERAQARPEVYLPVLKQRVYQMREDINTLMLGMIPADKILVPAMGLNSCFITAYHALKYLADNDRPSGGEAKYNSWHLHEIAGDLRKTIQDGANETP